MSSAAPGWLEAEFILVVPIAGDSVNPIIMSWL